MSKGTQLWPGERMREFYLAHIGRETSLEGPAAERLADALVRATNRMMVWDATIPAASDRPTSAEAETPSSVATPGADAAPEATPAIAPPFNPYQFSAMVVLTRSGRDGLARRLADIENGAHLRELAEAQHLAIAPHINDAETLREAIITATEQRIADRKAAAS